MHDLAVTRQTQAAAGHAPAAGLLLDVQGLRTWFHTRDGIVKAVDGVSLQLREGEILGLVGESGSGKSITGFSLMGLVDAPGKVRSERKSTRLNSSHVKISYAVFCLKKKKERDKAGQ